ncbi:MAG: tetratricopeptide repeat protein [Deltaproteobacteria bacterium]|nr:tetratricopeptide repeat protein [Deltaproteobacteria bacterium]
MAEYVDDLQAMLDAADAMLGEGELEQAFMLLDQLAVTYPDSPDVALMLGDAEFEYGNPEAALDEYDRVVEQDPTWSDAYSSRANCLIELGRLEEASADVDHALEIDPRSARSHYLRAVLMELASRDREAMEGYRTAAGLAPDIYHVPIRVTKRSFDRAIRAAVKLLPQRFKNRMEGVEIYVRALPEIDLPDFTLPEPGKQSRVDHSPLIMGVFEGIPLTRALESDRAAQPPPRICLYQKNIERICKTKNDLIDEIRTTIMHEASYHFGLDDGDLEPTDLQ